MHHRYIIFICETILTIVIIGAKENGNKEIDIIINNLLIALTNETTYFQSPKLNKMNQDLKNISNFVMQKDEVLNKLLEEASRTNLVKTEFFEALKGKSFFDDVNSNKSLYLKLKERLNREDILNILANKDYESKSINKSARRSLDLYPYRIPIDENEVLDAVIDKFLAKVPSDNHKLNDSGSIYWGKFH